jgi:hypothetical protein
MTPVFAKFLCGRSADLATGKSPRRVRFGAACARNIRHEIGFRIDMSVSVACAELSNALDCARGEEPDIRTDVHRTGSANAAKP